MKTRNFNKLLAVNVSATLAMGLGACAANRFNAHESGAYCVGSQAYTVAPGDTLEGVILANVERQGKLSEPGAQRRIAIALGMRGIYSKDAGRLPVDPNYARDTVAPTLSSGETIHLPELCTDSNQP